MAERKLEDVYSDKQQLSFRRVYEPRECDRHTEGHTTKKGPHWHWRLTGHCSTTNPASIHEHCKGVYESNGTVLNCICFCHHLSRQPRKPGTLLRPVKKAAPPPARVVKKVVKKPPETEAQPAASVRRVRRIQPR